MIYLDVPFAQKNQAKALGARWSPVEKKWYIPDELEAEQDKFSAWFSISNATASNLTETEIQQANQSVSQSTQTSKEKGISLSHLMHQVQSALRSRFPGATWVKAEIANINERRGHYYFELTETNEQGQPLATCRAMIWQRQAQALLQQFKEATGSDLQAGQKILLLAEVTFHEKFGFSLVIQDIDPAFTLGELEAKINEIRQQLIKENLWTRNKQLSMPLDFFRVAVIAPPAAAGLGDFRIDADILHSAGLCEFKYFYSAFQGEQVESEMLAAFEAFFALHRANPFDALVIIRGGGAKLDLNPLNNYLIARQICEANLPVLTGIGHERDNTILDEVANTRFDTPSKVIAGIRHTIFSRAQMANNHWQQIEKLSQLYIQQQQQSLQQLDQWVKQKSTQILHEWREKLMPLHYAIQQKSQQTVASDKAELARQIQAIYANVEHHVAINKQILNQQFETVESKPNQILVHAKQQINQTYRFIFSSGPQTQLNRGFAMTRDPQGKIIKNLAQAEKADVIQLEFKDGKLQAKVLSTSKK